MHVHILGICGTLMGSIALLAKELGHHVSGSDENIYPPMSTQLASSGIDVNSPYSAENIPHGVDLVMIGNANLPRGNPAVEYVLEKNIPYTSGAEWLGRHLLQDKWVLAVAGTHGKTTTASMLSWILEFAGMKPGFLIGGIPGNFSESARLGDTPFFVIEADEYDTSYFDRRSKFLHYKPRTLILNNLEYDHADIFPDLESIQNQFHLLMRTIPKNGLVIRPESDENLSNVIKRGCWSEELLIGQKASANGTSLYGTSLQADNSQFDVYLNAKKMGKVHWGLSGKHNMDNALSAIAAARHVGVTPKISCDALSGFKGVKRRMECIYQSDSTTIYDDFAHHPTAIKTTIDGLRKKVGNERIMVLIELGSHTMRLGTHENNLLRATTDADEVLWYSPKILNWDLNESLNKDKSRFVDSIEEILSLTLDKIRRGDVDHLIIMSNSSFGGIHKRLIDLLETD